MNKEILVISDNFISYSKYRGILESISSVSLRSNIDEIISFLENKECDLTIIDIDETLDNGLIDIIKVLENYNTEYLIIVDSPRKFINSVNSDLILDKDLISRQSIYPNLYSYIKSKANSGGDYVRQTRFE